MNGKNVARVAVAGLAVVGLAVGLGGGATAAAPAPIPNAKDSVTGWNVKDGTIYAADLGPGMVKWFTGGPYNNSVNSYTVKDGSLAEADLDAALKAKVNQVGTGEQGPAGPKGDTGAQGPAGDPATDAFGKEGGSLTIAPKAIATIGGSWATGKTELGTFTLPAGKYLINSAVMFDRLDANENGYVTPTTDTMPQFALRYGSTNEDAGTVMGSPVSKAGFVELTGSSTKAVTLTEETTITAYGFGYNEDRSSFGGGQIKVGGTVAAVRIG